MGGKVLIVACFILFMFSVEDLLKAHDLSLEVDAARRMEPDSVGGGVPKYRVENVADPRNGDIRLVQVENPDYKGD